MLYVLDDIEGVCNGNSCIINLVRGSLYKRVRQVLTQKFAQKSCSLYFEFAVIQGKVANAIVKDGQETRRNFFEQNCAFLLDEFSGKAAGGDPLELAADRSAGHGVCNVVGWLCAEES